MAEQVLITPSFFGEDAFSKLPSLLNGRRAFMLGGETALRKGTPFLPPDLVLCGQAVYGKECTMGAVRRAMSLAKSADAQVILGMGGGRAIDTAKGCAALLKLPVITLPSVASTCAAASALSVVYREDGSFDRFIDEGVPPLACLIHPTLLTQAPPRFIRAGMGDTVAKYFETEFSSRNDHPAFTSALALSAAPMCLSPILSRGAKAYEAVQEGKTTDDVREVLKAIIITTGLVSALIEERYNGALAHSLYYAISELHPQDAVWLHGEVVAYGVLVELLLDKKQEAFEKLYPLFHAMGLPVALKSLSLNRADPLLDQIIRLTLSESDMSYIPYQISESMLRGAIERLEEWAC